MKKLLTSCLLLLALVSKGDFIQNYPATTNVNPGDLFTVSATNASAYGVTKSVKAFNLGNSLITLGYPSFYSIPASALFLINSNGTAGSMTPASVATNLTPYIQDYAPFKASLFTSPALYTNVPTVSTLGAGELGSLFLARDINSDTLSTQNVTITFGNLISSVSAQLVNYPFNLDLNALKFRYGGGAQVLPVWPAAFSSTQLSGQPSFLTWGDGATPYYQSFSNVVTGMTNQLSYQLRVITAPSVYTISNTVNSINPYTDAGVSEIFPVYGAPVQYSSGTLISTYPAASFFKGITESSAVGTSGDWLKEYEAATTNLNLAGNGVKYTQKLYDPTGSQPNIYQILVNVQLPNGNIMDFAGTGVITNLASLYTTNIPWAQALINGSGAAATNYVNSFFSTSGKIPWPSSASTVLASSVLHNYNVSNVVFSPKAQLGTTGVYTNTCTINFTNYFPNTNYLVHLVQSYPIGSNPTNVSAILSVVQNTNSAVFYFNGSSTWGSTYQLPSQLYFDVIP